MYYTIMVIDENTKIIGRFHTKPSPRGLNIYNPYFQRSRTSAVYLLFYNPSPEPLIKGLRELNLAGAITAGFESNPELPKLLDELDDTAKFVGKVGFITNKNGVVKGYNQGGIGLLNAINSRHNIHDKKLVIVGAGNVVKSLIFTITKLPLNQQPSEIEIYNRTISNAEAIAKDFKLIKRVSELDKISESNGDILLNISEIGSKIEDTIFTEKLISNFSGVSDVTFEKESTNLISIAKKLNKTYSTGWDMFTFQGKECLEKILDIQVDAKLLKECVAEGLSSVVK